LGSSIVTAYLVIGFTISTIFNYWKPNCRGFPLWFLKSLVWTCPDKNNTGVDYNQAAAQPVIALVPPGPDVTRQTPKFLVYCAYASTAILALC
jgi:hypothetical protein